MASSFHHHLPSRTRVNHNPSSLLAVDIKFPNFRFLQADSLGLHNKHSSTSFTTSDTYARLSLINYFGRKSNGGGEVSGCITPWKKDKERALIIFEEGYCEPDIVERVIKANKRSDLEITAYTKPQYLGRGQLQITKDVQEKIREYYTYEQLSSEIETATGISLVCDRETNSVTLEGFFFQLKLAERCLIRLARDVDVRRENIAEKEGELYHSANSTIQDSDPDTVVSASQITSASDTKPQQDKEVGAASTSQVDSWAGGNTGLHRLNSQGDRLAPGREEEAIEVDGEDGGGIAKLGSAEEEPMVVELTDSGPDTKQEEKEEREEEEDSRATMPTEVEEQFDKIYYEFMSIVLEDEYKRQVLDFIAKKKGGISLRNDPNDKRMCFVVISGKQKDHKDMMKAVNELFSQTIRQVHSHTLKLRYPGGDLKRLKKAFVTDLRGASVEFVARLVTDEDIRIISYLKNLDRDITMVEGFVEDFKCKYPPVTPDTLPPETIVLNNGVNVHIIHGDLTETRCDVMVSSSDPDLSNMGGVAKAISRLCGPKFQKECDRQARLNIHKLHPGNILRMQAEGGLVLRNGVRFIIHAISPHETEPDAFAKLTNVVYKSIYETDKAAYFSIAFPAIGAAFPDFFRKVCLGAYWMAMEQFVKTVPNPVLREISFVCNDLSTVKLLQEAMKTYASGGSTGGGSAGGGYAGGGYASGGSAGGGYASGGSAGGGYASGGSTGGGYASGGYTGSGYTGSGSAGGGYTGSGSAGGGSAGGGYANADPPLLSTSSSGSFSRGGASNDPHQAQDASRWQDQQLAHAGRITDVSYGRHGTNRNSGSYDPSQRGSLMGYAPITYPSSAPITHPGSAARVSVDGQYDSNPRRRGSSDHRGLGALNDSSHTNGILSRTGMSSLDQTRDRPPGTGNVDTAANAGAAAPSPDDDRDNECPICMDTLKDPKKLKCGHQFCKDCMDGVVATSKSNLCPTCRTPFATAEGKQPRGGTMRITRSSAALPGYRCGTIIIDYRIPSGMQGPEHPHPGMRYGGTQRTAYLPDNTKGNKVMRLLEKAFDQRLVFTVGQSITTGADNAVVWNDIHHKTSRTGGPSSYGYPDPDYLDRTIEDLKAKGIE